MIVTCEKCSARFRLPDEKIGPDGAKVRCSKCGHGFRVHQEPEPVAVDDVMMIEDDDFTEVDSAEIPSVHEGETRVVNRPVSGGIDVLAPPDDGFGDDVTREVSMPGPGSSALTPAALSDVHDAKTAVFEVSKLRPTTTSGKKAAAPAQPAADPGFDPFADAGAATGGAGSSLGDELFGDLSEPSAADPSQPIDPFGGVGDEFSPEALSEPMPRPRSGTRRTGRVGRPASPVGRVINVLITLLAFVALAGGVTYLFAGATVRRHLGIERAPRALPKMDGVRVLSLRSVRYPTVVGDDALVIVGEAENYSTVNRSDVYVLTELSDRSGKVLRRDRAPLGLALGPQEVHGLSDLESLKKAYLTRFADQEGRAMPARKVSPYTVVILNPPPGAGDLNHALKLETGEPLVMPDPEPVAAPEDEIEEEGRRKGKRKGRKGKRKGKRKRRRKKVDEGA